MTTRGIIFDLDNTLIDTRISEKYRTRGQWDRVYHLVQNEYRIDPYLLDNIKQLKNRGVKVSVVSSSLLDYCNHALNVVGLAVDYVIGYGDTIAHKPDPEPVYMAKALMGQPDIVVGIGDSQRDMNAYQQAGVYPVLFSQYSGIRIQSSGIYVCEDMRSLFETINRLLFRERDHIFGDTDSSCCCDHRFERRLRMPIKSLRDICSYSNDTVAFLALKDLARELNVSSDIIQHWLKYGLYKSDRCYWQIKKHFPELEPQRIPDGVCIEPPASMNPHALPKNTFVEEDFKLDDYISFFTKLGRGDYDIFPF